jgi:hypothetical protein
MTENSNICCWDCSYFNGVNSCCFLNKPTTRDTHCFAKLYQLVDVCEDFISCEICPHLFNSCNGDRTNAPKKLRIFPHEGQLRIKNSKAQYVAALAGAQSGKTEFMPSVMHDEMLKRGSGDYMAVSSSFPLMDKKLVPIYRQYFEQYLHIGHWQEAKKKLLVESGDLKCTIFFGSAKNTDSLESATAKAAHLDESGQDDFTLDSYEAVLRRVSGNNGRIFFTTTLYNFGYLKSEVYDRWKNGDSDYEVIQWDSIIRPGFSKTVWEDRKRKMQPWKFDMQLRGIYSRPAGMVYSDFNESVHLIKPFNIPSSWNWHVGIDPGAVHTALVWVAEEPATNKYYIARSYLDGNKTTKEHVKKAMQEFAYGKVIRWVGGAGSEEQFRMDWTNEGIHVREPEIRDVEAGIDRVTALLREKRLFILNTDENAWLIDEMRSYSRELDEQGQPTDKIKDKNKFHGMDGIRYWATGIGMQGNYSTPIEFQNRKMPIFQSHHNIYNVIGERVAPPKYR